jgi:putative chitinase
MTPVELLRIMPHAGSRAGLYAPFVTEAMTEFGISNPIRQAAFLAQVCHESGSLRYTEEIASGEAYEGRADLGNTQPGDGKRYKGRGLLQITGRANYRATGNALNIDLEDSPHLLSGVSTACRASAWWWREHGCNELADKDVFGALTKRINGGYTGFDDRIQHWLRARKVLGL